MQNYLYFSLCVLFFLTASPEVILASNNEDLLLRKQVIEQEEVQQAIQKEKENVSNELQKVEKLAVEAREKAKTAENETQKALAEFLVQIQSYRSEISNLKLEKISLLEKQVEEMRAKTEKIKDLRNKLETQPEQLSMRDLARVTEIWRDIVDPTISSLFAEDVSFLVQAPVEQIDLDLDEQGNDKIKTEIKEARRLANKELKEADNDIQVILRSKRDVSARLLLNAGRVRADLMNSLIASGKYSVWNIELATFKDVFRELQIVPHRLLAIFAEKYFDFKHLSVQGPRGWFEVLKQIFLLLFVCFLPYLIFRLFGVFSAKLEEFRRQIFTRSELDYRKRTRLALWIGRLNPYLPWFFAYITVEFSFHLLLDTLLEPMTLAFPYLKIYISYRVFLMLFSSVLAKLLLSKSLESLRTKQQELKTTAMKLSILFFVEWTLLHAIEDAVRQAIVYNMIFDVVVYLNVYIVAIEIRKWKDELQQLSSSWLPENYQELVLQQNSRVVNLVLCPLLFTGNAVFIIWSWFVRWAGQYDFGKQITSEIFKKRLEEVSTDTDKLYKEVDASYESLFCGPLSFGSDLRVNLSKSPFQKCVDLINRWNTNKTHDDLFLLYGNYGIGKSSLLSSLENYFKDELRVASLKVEGKITKVEALYKMISRVLGEPISSVEELQEYDKNCPKTLLIVDDVHNLYLNLVGGLEAYRTLIELTSLQLDNIFWCLSCNERALAHLNGVFGKNHFSGMKLELLSWTDSEIQELIVKRHRQSGMKVRFDQVISAVHRGDILESSSSLEVQFFRLLWGQSRGNPSTAQELWLSSVRRETGNSITIMVPEFTSPKSMATLADEALVILAAIVKHENLSFDEIQQVCKEAPQNIRHAIKYGEDGMLLDKISENRWRIHAKAQYVVYSQLEGRNLIYG